MDIHTIAMKKPKRLYVLKYSEGSEERAVEEVMRWADDPACEIDWQDAANISWRVLNSITANFDSLAKPTPTAIKGGKQG